MNKRLSFLSFLALFSLVACSKPGGNTGKVKVTFDLCNGDPNVVVDINKGSKITEQPTASKYGCNFLSYQKDKKDFDFNTPINEDTVLKAHYEYNADELFKLRDNPEKRHDDTANLRVMSFNMLVSVYQETGGVKPKHHGTDPTNAEYSKEIDDGRDYQAFRTIQRYLPDIIGIQECDETDDEKKRMPDKDYGWYEAFEKYQAKHSDFHYKIINADKHRTKIEDVEHCVYSTIAYNTDKITLDEESGEPCYGTRLSEFSDNDNCRYLTWAKFHTNDSSKHFIVTSTHWNLSRTCTEEARIAQARESALLTIGKQAHYSGIPVITTGDYNQKDFGKPYMAFLESSGYKDSKYDAAKRGFVNASYHLGEGVGKENYRTKGSVLRNNPDDTATIDHIFLSPNVKCHYYDIITEEDAVYSSDHLPSYVDVTI